MSSPPEHPFVSTPHRTLVALSIPVLFSLIAEPLTGLADTAFVARLGSTALAALGVGTVVLSSSFWIFNFLGVGTQTEVAQALGAGRGDKARGILGLALILAFAFGVAITVAGILGARPVSRLMGAEAAVLDAAVAYLRIRLIAAPAVLVTTVAFGALRGLQDMKSPLWIAVSINVMNIVLDAALIFGVGPIPALGIAGAAWATVFSQVAGAAWALLVARRRIGLSFDTDLKEAGRLLVVGRDMFVRTGLLSLFLLLTTRSATRIGTDAGAAHQAIRQVWVFSALVLDAFAASAQSLVGYFIGAGRREVARRVALVACQWSFGTGVVLALGMWVGQGWVAQLLVPESGRAVFAAAWMASAIFQPLNALSFATDGIHWGTADYRYLRNAMVVATGLGAAGLFLIDESGTNALTLVWVVTGGWIVVRSVLGMIRVWPGIGRSPFRAGTGNEV